MGFIERRGGATVFLVISVASFLTGGGLAQVLLFMLNWAAATRIRASLRFWQRIMPTALRRILARVWGLALISAAILFLAALEIATIGYFPGLPHETQALTRILWRLAAAIITAVVLAIVAGFARDLEVGDMGPLPSKRFTIIGGALWLTQLESLRREATSITQRARLLPPWEFSSASGPSIMESWNACRGHGRLRVLS